MADTGAPYFIPYVEPSDLVRNYPAASEELADAIVLALDGAGGLVEVKSALFTGTQTASVLAGANVAVTDLTITHALAAAGNKLIISAFIGGAASSTQTNTVGVAIHDGTNLIAIGDSDQDRTQVTAGGQTTVNGSGIILTMPAVTFVHAPGDTSSRTYTVRAINTRVETQTLFINRMETNNNSASRSVTASGFVIQEVKV